MTEINNENFEEMIKKGNIMIDFFAEWCGPCKLMKPVFDNMSKKFPKIKFYKVDVDKNPDVASALNIRSIPTIMFLKNGEEMDRVMGTIPEDEFKNKISAVFK